MWNKTPGLFLVVAALAAIAVYLQMIRPFAWPLVFACLLAVLFWPIYCWVTRRCFGHRRIAAALTTGLIIIAFLLPLASGLVLAAVELVKAVQQVSQSVDIDNLAEELNELPAGNESAGNESAGNESAGNEPAGNEPAGNESAGNESEQQSAPVRQLRELRSRFSEKDIHRIRELASESLATAVQSIYNRTVELVANLFSFVVGSAIMVLALYYFFADNEQILDEVRRLSPLDADDDREITNSFVQVCRGIFYGNILAALFQAILNGLAFLVLGIETAGVLAFITFFLSLIPFVGAGAVWLFVVIGLLFQQRYLEAGLLTAYGLLIVSTVDNLIRAYALRGSTRIHPLVALISILGGIHLVGLWGIVVGPVTAAFCYALLDIINKKVEAGRHNESRELVLPTTLSAETAPADARESGD